MSLDPQTIHAESNREIGQIIERDAELITDHWYRRALQEQPTAHATHRQDLRNHLPEFLRAMGQGLASQGTGGPTPHSLLAIEHGEQRWQVGWHLGEVVRDYQILRLVILDHLEDLLIRTLSIREVMAVGLFLDEAITAAVITYVALQDHYRAEAEHRHRTVVDHVIDGILTINDDGIVESLNPAAERIFGWNAREAIGQFIGQFVTLPENCHSRSEVAKFLRGEGEPVAGSGREVVGLRNGNESFSMDLATSEMQLGDRQLFTAIVRDITDRKRAESELKHYAQALEAANQAFEQASAAAQAANRAKSEFLANMSHEIRTPMTAILGFAEVLQGTVTNPDDRDAVHTIKRNGEYLIEIINDILDLSKIEAGRLEIEQVQCEPPRLLAEVVSLMRVKANSKGIALEIERGPKIPATILTDPTRLRQILVNLVGNAIKFTEQGGVRLQMRFLPDSQPARLQFEVSDTGIGMTMEQMQHIFLPFSQAENSTSRRFGGTGLGLTISKQLAEVLGGYITIESRPGQGSIFRLAVATGPLDGIPFVAPELPEAAAEAVSSDTPPAKVLKLNYRILVADDRRDNRYLIGALLSRAGARVTAAENGRMAIEQIRSAEASETPFDLILMDMQMPEMDGYEAVTELRATGCRTPIIALTASAMKGDREKCLDAGCDDYTPKPIDHVRLTELVAHYCQSPGRDRKR